MKNTSNNMEGGLTMINCENIKSMLSAYIDNELNDIDKLNIEKHLKTCSNCTKELHELEQIISLVANYGDEDLPIGFGDDLHMKLINANVTDKKKSGAAILKNKYLRICSTIAAGLLICFMLKDYFTGVLFGVNEKMSSSSSQNMVMSQEAGDTVGKKEAAKADDNIVAYDRAMTKDSISDVTSGKMSDQATTENTNRETIKSEDAKSAIDTFSGTEEMRSAERSNDSLNTSPLESVTEDTNNNNPIEEPTNKEQLIVALAPEESQVMMAYPKAFMDNAGLNSNKLINKISITVAVYNIDSSIAQIKEYAAANNYVIYEHKPYKSTIGIRLLEADYEKFIDYLNNTFGKSKISFGPMNIIDALLEIANINTQINNLNTKIEQLESKKDYDRNELKLMQSERDKLRVQVENLTKDTGYTIIDLSFILGN